jgi:hypothetical protein
VQDGYKPVPLTNRQLTTAATQKENNMYTVTIIIRWALIAVVAYGVYIVTNSMM